MLTFLRFYRSSSGLSAVEFALIAPVLCVLLLGTIVVCNALECRQKLVSEASSVADLVAQASTLSSADLQDIFQSGTTIMYPFTASGTIVVSSIVNNPQTGANTVAWSQGYNGGRALPVNSAVTVPTGVISAGGSAIFVQVGYSYTSPIGGFFINSIPMSDSFYCRPRESTAVNYTG
ncbi:MAG TPA: TadE/TadG family type IV pilus assembly protein [Rhizomicrobium sp.]|nr:TadE/TadG family type IV pilus assembly protein [Rhizomicrobium sp.]